MQVKIFTIPFNANLGTFDDEVFSDFVKDKEILSASDHLFLKNDIPYITIILKYNLQPIEMTSPVSKEASSHQAKDESWKKIIKEDEMPLFNTLRQWRSEKSKKDGVPPYIILNNKQLAEVIQRRPQSKYDLMKVDGIGKAKAEKYGDDILKITLNKPLAMEEISESATSSQ